MSICLQYHYLLTLEQNIQGPIHEKGPPDIPPSICRAACMILVPDLVVVLNSMFLDKVRSFNLLVGIPECSSLSSTV